MFSTEHRLFDAVVLFVLALLCVPFGFDSLRDLDLGWHLAGGLWILEQLQVPGRDFLASPGTTWIAYSWLAEVFFAAAYRIGGFETLQIIQFLLIWLSVSLAYLASISNAATLRQRYFAALITLAAVPLFAPFWHLRPQLLSVLFFGLLLLWSRCGRLSFPRVLLVTLVWVNCHVFWPLAAATYLYGSRAALLRRFVGAMVLLAAGLLSPYGIQNIGVVAEYTFNHSAGYRLIKEFRPMSTELGFLFWYFVALGAIAAYLCLRKSDWKWFLPAFVFFAAALFQRKYLPFFALSGAFAVTKFAPVEKPAERAVSRPTVGLVFAIMAALLFSAVAAFRAEPIPERIADLFKIVRPVAAARTADNVTILNDFDDGGWLELALYVNRPASSDESPYKAAIDGRTLVMGEKRLEEYAEVYHGRATVCALVKMWEPDFAIFSNGSQMLARLKARNETCERAWETVLTTEHWTLLKTL